MNTPVLVFQTISLDNQLPVCHLQKVKLHVFLNTEADLMGIRCILYRGTRTSDVWDKCVRLERMSVTIMLTKVISIMSQQAGPDLHDLR